MLNVRRSCWTTDEDALDIWFDIERGRVVAFSVNYRAFLQGEWKEVVRYDTAHGILHVHEFWPRGCDRIQRLERTPAVDYTQALAQAKEDLDANWQTYRKNMEANG